MPALESVTQDSHERNRRYVCATCVPPRLPLVQHAARWYRFPRRECGRSSGSGELDREAEYRFFFFLSFLFSFFPSLPRASSLVVASPRIANYYVSIYARPQARRVTSEPRSRGIRGRAIRPIYPSSAIFFSLLPEIITVAVDLSAGENVYRKHVGLDWSLSRGSNDSGKLMMIVHEGKDQKSDIIPAASWAGSRVLAADY